MNRFFDLAALGCQAAFLALCFVFIIPFALPMAGIGWLAEKCGVKFEGYDGGCP